MYYGYKLTELDKDVNFRHLSIREIPNDIIINTWIMLNKNLVYVINTLGKLKLSDDVTLVKNKYELEFRFKKPMHVGYVVFGNISTDADIDFFKKSEKLEFKIGRIVGDRLLLERYLYEEYPNTFLVAYRNV